MANVKITDLAALTNPASTDVLPIVDVGADVTKKVSIADLLENAGSGTASAPGIAFDGDSNTGIYRPGADQLAISTSGTSRLHIASDGKVGVGTTSPSATLHASGGSTVAILQRTGTGACQINVGDSNLSNIYYDADAHYFRAGNGTERLRITSDGKVGLGTSAVLSDFHIASSLPTIRLEDDDVASQASYALIKSSSDGGLQFDADPGNARSSTSITFDIDGGEKARIDSFGRLLVGTSSPRGVGSSASARTQLEVGSELGLSIVRNTNDASGAYLTLGHSRGANPGGTTIVNDNDILGAIRFAGADGVDLESYGVEIRGEVDGTPGADDMPGRLVFSTTADGASSPTERMIIKNNGNILVGTNSDAGFTFQVSRDAGAAGFFNRNTDDGAVVGFGRSTSLVGTISVTTTATAYNTSSDYRLKENVVPLTGAADRINQLQVRRFNFIADPDKTVDGFLAHEAQAVVPECVTGTKDEVDADGNPVYQGIDQSKLVPLLTAALQEAIGRIETLETEVAALKAA